MVGKIMKTKTLTSYDQLVLAMKRGSYDGPVPKPFSQLDSFTTTLGTEEVYRPDSKIVVSNE